MAGFIRRAISGTLTAEDDNRYWRNLGYVFELVLPGNFRVAMPILLGPTEYTFTREFTQDIEIAQDGGVHVAEYGIIQGRIHIRVDPGVGPRRPWNAVVIPGQRGSVVSALSGHRRWMQIRDELFLRYSELKKNPSTSADTRLIFHSLKDDSSYVVIPSELELSRQSSAAAAYPYSVDMTAVEKWDGARPELVGPDRGLFDMLADPARQIRSAIQLLDATIDDATFYLNEAQLVATSWNNVIRDTGRLVESLGTFLAGVDSLIRIPYTTVTALAFAYDRLAGAVDDWGALSYSARTWARGMEQRLNLLAMFPAEFSPTLDARERRLALARAKEAGYSPQELASAPGTIGGSGARATDYLRAAAANATAAPGGYSGWVEICVDAFTAPEAIAARYDVDWAIVAAANGLRHPYFSDAGLPGTVGPGAKIVVPVAASDTRAMAGISRGEGYGTSRQAELFGRDLLLDDAEGLAVDTRYGALDFALVEGVDNVVQAVGIRLQTTQGSNLAYPTFGRLDFVGRVATLEAALLARVDTRRTLLEDPRIQEIKPLDIVAEADSVSVDATLLLADWSTTRAQGRL